MGHSSENAPFIPLSIAVLNLADSRTPETDTSGSWLAEALVPTGHARTDRSRPCNLAAIAPRLYEI